MSRHLPRNLATKRYVMSCRDICQDIWSHEREASSGAHLDENFKSRNQRNFVRLLPFDVNLLDLECHFRNLSAIIAPRCAFIPRAQRAEQNFSPVGPNVMSRRDICQGSGTVGVMSRRDICQESRDIRHEHLPKKWNHLCKPQTPLRSSQ